MSELIRSWGPATRRMVGEIELSGDREHIRNIEGGWSGFDPLAPLLIDRSEAEIRTLLGSELEDFDRSAKLNAIRARAAKDPARGTGESLTVFDTYGFDHPVAFFLISHVGGLVQDAYDLNFDKPGQKPHWVMGKVQGRDILGERMLP